MRRKKKRIPSGAKPRVYPKKLVPSSYPGSSSRDIGDYISWRFDLLYGEPCFGWDTLSTDDHRFLHECLKKFESLTVSELFSGYPGKTYNNPFEIPNSEARQRFLDCYQDEDCICRLRCGGKPRLYGFRRGTVFLALWWDKEHEIWPTQK